MDVCGAEDVPDRALAVFCVVNVRGFGFSFLGLGWSGVVEEAGKSGRMGPGGFPGDDGHLAIDSGTTAPETCLDKLKTPKKGTP